MSVHALVYVWVCVCLQEKRLNVEKRERKTRAVRKVRMSVWGQVLPEACEGNHVSDNQGTRTKLWWAKDTEQKIWELLRTAVFSLEIKYILEVQQESLYQHVVFNETDLELPTVYLLSVQLVRCITRLMLQHTPEEWSEIVEDVYGSGQDLYLMQRNNQYTVCLIYPYKYTVCTIAQFCYICSLMAKVLLLHRSSHVWWPQWGCCFMVCLTQCGKFFWMRVLGLA